MSETDDTDVLLLIPPDFFLVRSSGSEESLLESSRTVVHKPPSCTAQVIGKLVHQVHSLESRLGNLEINTSVTDSSLATIPRRRNWDSDSFDSKSIDSKYFTFPRRRRRKNRKNSNNTTDLSLTSLESIGDKIPRLKLRQFELVSLKSKDTVNGSMDGDISSIISTPSKKNDKLLLNEIDEFLTKVESYETPETKFKQLEAAVSPENVIKATGDYISNKLYTKDDIELPSGKTISANVLDKYIYLVKSNTQSVDQSDMETPSTSALRNQNEEPLPKVGNRAANLTTEPTKFTEHPKSYTTNTKSPCVKKINFSDKEVQPTSTPVKPQLCYTDSFKPSSNKIYDRATKVLEQYKSQNYSQSQPSSDSYLKDLKEFKMPQMRPFIDSKDGFKHRFMESIDTDLLSLSDLWGEGDKIDNKNRGDSSKLEEERLKREHCEAMIQQLQKKLLDQQERLAVAVKVDRAKDIAITKLKESWLKLTGSLDKAEERHRQELDKMMAEVQNFKQVAKEAQKKTNHFEGELYKALDLAHDYQEKCKQLIQQTTTAQEDMDKAISKKNEEILDKDKQIQTLQDNYTTMMTLNKQSSDCVKNLEEALEREKADHEATKAKITELIKKIDCIEDETSLLREERDLLKVRFGEERSRGDMLQAQLQEKKNYCSELERKCDNLEGEVKALHNHLELQKNELKTHYQKQLEDAVLAKLQEFQHQLELAESEMEQEARGKEARALDACQHQLRRVEEQHKLEISVLEEKHREEIKLCRLQLAQANERIGLLEGKVESYRRRRGQIAAQLHGVMEAQWRQALHILTNSTRPPTPTHAPHTAHTAPARPLAHTGGACGAPLPAPTLPPAPPPPTLPPAPPDLALGLDALSDHELQQYVRLLLNKPSSIDGSGESRSKDTIGAKDFGYKDSGYTKDSGYKDSGYTKDSGYKDSVCTEEEPTSDRPERERRARRSLGHKPPWKA